MDGYIGRSMAVKAFRNAEKFYDPEWGNKRFSLTDVEEILNGVEPAVVFCKDCIHRPYETVPGVRYGLTVESSDEECPCFNPDDGWYSYIPDDDFFCGNGERLREGGTDGRKE